MANEQRGEVSLDVGNKRYTLRPTFNCLCALEELTGKTFVETAAAANRGSAVAMRTLVWAYLQECHGDEIVTAQDAGRFVSEAGGLDVITAALQKLMAMNTEPAGGKGRPRKAQDGTGATSTLRRVESA